MVKRKQTAWQRAIQTIRRQGTTFIRQLEERTGTYRAHTHPLFSGLGGFGFDQV